jgi:LuxR family maltose regulon positive regulatory protein
MGLALAVDSAIGLAITWQALGDDDQARGALLDMALFLNDIGSIGPIKLLRSCQARLALSRGDLEEAGRQLRLVRDDGSAQFPSFVELPEVTRARWLLLQGTASSLEEVGSIVAALRRRATLRQNALSVLRAECLQALWLQAQGDTEGALAVLSEVVALTRPGEVIRHLVDLGPPMHRLLVELDRWTSPSDPFLARLIAAIPSTTGPLVVAAPSRPERGAQAVDALTWRELEILGYLDARMSNKEIARLLYISAGTVKRHTANIYQKLGVGSRREAVSRAHSLGLLRVKTQATPPSSLSTSEGSATGAL